MKSCSSKFCNYCLVFDKHYFFPVVQNTLVFAICVLCLRATLKWLLFICIVFAGHSFLHQFVLALILQEYQNILCLVHHNNIAIAEKSQIGLSAVSSQKICFYDTRDYVLYLKSLSRVSLHKLRRKLFLSALLQIFGLQRWL